MLIFFGSHLHIVCCAEQNDRKEEDDRHNNERSELSAVGEIRTRRQGDDERDDDEQDVAHDGVEQYRTRSAQRTFAVTVCIGKSGHEKDCKTDAPDEVGIEGGKSCRGLYAENDTAECNAENKGNDAADKERLSLMYDAFRDFGMRAHFAARRADLYSVLSGARLQIGKIDAVK